jgi:hypothetical protein
MTPVMLICSACDDMPHPARGSRRDACSRCKRQVWVAPSTPLLQQLSLPIFCLPCATVHQREQGGELIIMPPSEQQLVEMREEGIPANRDELVKLARAHFEREAKKS